MNYNEDFIHLATEDQVEKIASKFFANPSEVVVLRLNVKELPGRLVYESNPGGSNKYYHLYESSILFKAIESHMIEKKQDKYSCFFLFTIDR